MLQGRWYDRGKWKGTKTLFVIVMVVAAISAFSVRLILVNKFHWNHIVHRMLQKSGGRQVLIATIVPPVVDAIQTVLLIAASLMTKTFEPNDNKKDSKYDPCENSGEKCEVHSTPVAP